MSLNFKSQHLFRPTDLLLIYFQFCIPQSGQPYYKCKCRAGYLLYKRTKCQLSATRSLLIITQQNPGMIRGLDIADPASEVREFEFFLTMNEKL